MTRIICIGDCHFGPNGRNEDRYRALDQIIDFGMSWPIGAWLFAGDVNHAKMTIDDRNAIAGRLQAMAEHASILIVYGNHDVAGDLEIFTKLKAAHPIVVATRPLITHLPLAGGGTAAVFTLPYVHKGALVGAGVAHDALTPEVQHALDPIFMAGAADLLDARAAGELPIVLAHMNIGGAITSVGQPSIGRELELDPRLLARLPDCPKIFGHIHKHQDLYGAWYLGSICRLDFGEQESKVFGVVTFQSPTDWTIDFIPIAVPGQYHVEGRLEPDAFTWAVTAGPDGPVSEPPTSWAGQDVRVRYRYAKAHAGAIDLQRIREVFAGCRTLKLDGVPELEHEVRAPEIISAATLDEKVVRYAERHGIEVTDGFRLKLNALMGPDLETFVAAIQSDVARVGATKPAEQPAEEAVAR